jgi:hypothetical protein
VRLPFVLLPLLLLTGCPAPPEAPPVIPMLDAPLPAATPDPKGSSEFVSGPKIKGTAVYGEGLAPLPGATVVEWDVPGAKPVVTGDDGVFVIELTHVERPALKVTKPGYLDTIQIATAESRLYFDGEFKIELFELADEQAVHEEDFGVPWDAGTARVVLNFQPLGSPYGVTGTIAAGRPWTYDDDDRPHPGTTIPDYPGIGEIVWTEVPPGTYDVTVTPRDGIRCPGPSPVPALPQTSTRAYFFCRALDGGDAPRVKVKDIHTEMQGG